MKGYTKDFYKMEIRAIVDAAKSLQWNAETNDKLTSKQRSKCEDLAVRLLEILRERGYGAEVDGGERK